MKKLMAILIVTVFVLATVSANKLIVVDKESLEYGKWAIQQLKTHSPFNETHWSLYRGTNIKESKGDLKVQIKDINAFGYGFPTGENKAGSILISPNVQKNWEFLFFHEAGHAYSLPHSQDHSIMDLDGGDSRFRDYQIKIIRSNLKK